MRLDTWVVNALSCSNIQKKFLDLRVADANLFYLVVNLVMIGSGCDCFVDGKRVYWFGNIARYQLFIVMSVDCVCTKSSIKRTIYLLNLIYCFNSRVFFLLLHRSSSRAWNSSTLQVRWNKLVRVRCKIHNVLVATTVFLPHFRIARGIECVTIFIV